MAMELEEVVTQVEALEAASNRGELSQADFRQQANALWGDWLASDAPEARVLSDVLASLGGPDVHERVQHIWENWLQKIRREEG